GWRLRRRGAAVGTVDTLDPRQRSAALGIRRRSLARRPVLLLLRREHAVAAHSVHHRQLADIDSVLPARTTSRRSRRRLVCNEQLASFLCAPGARGFPDHADRGPRPAPLRTRAPAPGSRRLPLDRLL